MKILWEKEENEIIRENATGAVMKYKTCAPREHNFATVMNMLEGPTVVMCTKCGAWTEPKYIR